MVNPDFFGMGDNDIRTSYWVHNRGISHSGAGYFFFLIETKKIAVRLVNEFQQRFNTADPAIWISKRVAINPPLSLIKFIDEFNWLFLEKGGKGLVIGFLHLASNDIRGVKSQLNRLRI